MTPETCRDLLRDMLAVASNLSDFDDLLDFHGYPAARIRAAIAADDAERERRADRPTTLGALAAGHPAAERQLRALRAAERYVRFVLECDKSRTCAADIVYEITKADAAAKEATHG